jgi:UPF0042 nucleotide-binding protein
MIVMVMGNVTTICSGTEHHRGGRQSHRPVHLRVTSFGSGRSPAPKADLTVDLAEWFRDPHVSPAMRSMTARDPEVVASVMETPGAHAFVERLFTAVEVLVDLGLGTVSVATGCVGGRHRGPVVATQLAARARAAGWTVEIHHRDLDKPVLTSRRATSAADQHATRGKR